MIPSRTDEEEAEWTWTSGEVGLEVKMKEGERAICCSVALASASREVLPGVVRGRSVEAIEGEGEGGRVMLVWEEAFPLDLRIS